ncbi:hypothetical protein [Methylocystis heyeri]|uniref:Uncharacterized protein n=1 Tax=Methylocystis heyeri TaxID=391905 RepID=A0A6B8KG17_9HYPH|nr:hypothetical protein [Methylocystis heyeri]QGM45935.1 hypothetical protein H2LOC_009595 [Methylocystis heyeri]
MLIADLIHSCSNANVAEAAVCCIGGSFAERVAAVAVKNGMNVGRFVAAIVRDFGRRANDEAIDALRRQISGTDQPLLHGLVHVLEPVLHEGVSFYDDETLGAPVSALRGSPWYAGRICLQ